MTLSKHMLAVVFFLSTLTNARPGAVRAWVAQVEDDTTTDSTTTYTESEWCTWASQIATWEEAERAQHQIDLSNMLDSVIRNTGDHDQQERWIQGFASHLDKYTQSDVSAACASLGLDCKVGADDKCKDVFAADDKTTTYGPKAGFWVFRAVRGVHEKIKLIHQEVESNTLISSLRIDNMVEAFDGHKEAEAADKNSLISILSAIFGMGGGAAGVLTGPAGPVAGGVMTVIGGAFSLASSLESDNKGTELVKLGDMKEALSDMYQSSSKALKEMLKLAMGMRQGKGPKYDDLPSLGAPNSPFAVTRFFDSPFWLMEGVSNGVESAIETVGSNLRVKLIDTILQSSGWAVAGHDEIDNEETCMKKTDGMGKWFEIEHYGHVCWGMWKKNADEWVPAVKDSPIFKGMKDYGFVELEEYYRKAIECASSGRSRHNIAIDPGSVIPGEMPLCFLSTPVVRVKKEKCSGDGTFEPVKCWNDVESFFLLQEMLGDLPCVVKSPFQKNCRG